MLVRMQNRMELLSCLKSIHGLKRRRPAGCSRLRSGPVRQRAGFSRVGPEVAASCRSVSSLPSSLLPGPARPSAAAAAPGCPVLRARFTCTLSSRTFGKIRASFHSCFYVQPTSGRRDPASSTLFLIGFGRCGLAVGPLIDCREHWRQEKKESVLRRRVGGGTG